MVTKNVVSNSSFDALQKNTICVDVSNLGLRSGQLVLHIVTIMMFVALQPSDGTLPLTPNDSPSGHLHVRLCETY